MFLSKTHLKTLWCTLESAWMKIVRCKWNNHRWIYTNAHTDRERERERERERDESVKHVYYLHLFEESPATSPPNSSHVRAVHAHLQVCNSHIHLCLCTSTSPGLFLFSSSVFDSFRNGQEKRRESESQREKGESYHHTYTLHLEVVDTTDAVHTTCISHQLLHRTLERV